MTMSRRSSRFDAAYYDRYYRNPKTRVETAQDRSARAAFVTAYLKHLRQPVRRILDIGCGLGYWRSPLRRSFPRASYRGVEPSTYLCERYGWEAGSVVDYAPRGRFDLVICQDVLQYLDARDAARAIGNLALLCRGVLYLQVTTAEDWRENCDRELTDGDVHLRPASWYRRRLKAGFVNAGGGMLVSRDSPVVLYALERTDV